MKTRLTVLFVAFGFAACVAGNTVGGLDAGGTPDGATPGDSGAEDSGRAQDSGPPSDAGSDAGPSDAGTDGGCGGDTCGLCPFSCTNADVCLPGGTWQCNCDCSPLDAGSPCTTSSQCTGTGSSVTSCPSSAFSCIDGTCVWACGPGQLTCDYDAGVNCLTCTNPASSACGCGGSLSSATVEQSTCPGISAGEVWALFSSDCSNVSAGVGAINKGHWSFVQGYLIGTLAGTGNTLCFGEMLPTGAIRAVFGCGDCQVQLVFH